MSSAMKEFMNNLPSKEDIAEILFKLKDLTGNLNLPSKDELLSNAGLRTRSTTTEDVLMGLGMFGAGILVGAGIALMFAPKSGRELRQDLSERASELRDEYIGGGEPQTHSAPI